MTTPNFVKAELTRQVEAFELLASSNPEQALNDGPLLKQDLDMFQAGDAYWTDTSPPLPIGLSALAIKVALGWDSLQHLNGRLAVARNKARVNAGQYRPDQQVNEPTLGDVLSNVDVGATTKTVSQGVGQAAGTVAGVAGEAAGAGVVGFLQGGGVPGVLLVLVGLGVVYVALRVTT